MNEIWKDIEGYEGLYQISNLGRIKSLPREIKITKRKLKEKILKPILLTKGYYCVHLYRDGKQRIFYIHILIAKAFVLNSYKKPEVNHKDGVKVHNEAYNLEWVTPKENVRHKEFVLGKHNRGENNGQAKLSNCDVLFIRVSSLIWKELAKKFNVSYSTIRFIKNNKTWRHLKKVHLND